MPEIEHPNGTKATVSEAVLPFWTGPAGWKVATPAAQRSRARSSGRSRSGGAKPKRGRAAASAPTTTPDATTGAPDDVPGQGSSTTTTKE